jgi:hypothetical protein
MKKIQATYNEAQGLFCIDMKTCSTCSSCLLRVVNTLISLTDVPVVLINSLV